MSISVAPGFILEYENDLIDSVSGYIFTNLAASPSPEFVVGKIGNCTTKTMPGYVYHTNEDIPLLTNFAADFSVFGWIKCVAATASFMQFVALTNSNSAVVNLKLSLVTADQITLATVAKVSGTQITTTSTINGTETGTAWHFVALTVRASDARFRMYDNGQLLQEWTQTGFAVTTKNGDGGHDADPHCISKFRLQSQSNSQKYVDQVGVIPAECTPNDVSYMYNGGLGRAYSDWELPTNTIKYIDTSKGCDESNSLTRASITGHTSILDRKTDTSIASLGTRLESRFRDVRNYF